MNLGLLMNVNAPATPAGTMPSSPVSAGNAQFGSVFQSMMATDAQQNSQTDGDSEKLASLMDGILDAESLEELENLLEQLQQVGQKSTAANQLMKDLGLHKGMPARDFIHDPLTAAETAAAVFNELKGEGSADLLAGLTDEAKQILSELAHQAEEPDGQTDIKAADEALQLSDISNLNKFPRLQQLASLISSNSDKLIEQVTKVLEAAGAADEDIKQLMATGDIWFALDMLQQLPPEQLQSAIANELPEKAAVELTALFKAVELAAPKLDLYGKQPDLVKMIQPLLAQFAEKLEPKIPQPEVKQMIQLPQAIQHMIRFSSEQPSAETKQQEQSSKPAEAPVLQSALTQTESRPVFQTAQADKAPESRSEALMREFQAVLNRANFGQVNGTNRISIKLYPEHLGQVRIELLEVNGVMTARILASTAMAREMLDSQMHQLRHAFSQQNLQVERIDLAQAVQDPSKNEKEQAFNKQSEQQKEQPAEQQSEQDDSDRSFEVFMIELEV